MKPKWKAWLMEIRGNRPEWKYVEYVERDRAIRTARDCARRIAVLYIQAGRYDPPYAEEQLGNGGVLFRVHGVFGYNKWPRVETIDE